jgi:uncharacterized protein (DUF4415 family)
MSAAITGKKSKKKTYEPRTNWKRLRSLTDAQIRRAVSRGAEAHPTDEAFWATAKVVLPHPKKTVTMRLDADLLDWFRANRGYQTRINAILRAYMNAQVQQR